MFSFMHFTIAILSFSEYVKKWPRKFNCMFQAANKPFSVNLTLSEIWFYYLIITLVKISTKQNREMTVYT